MGPEEAVLTSSLCFQGRMVTPALPGENAQPWPVTGICARGCSGLNCDALFAESELGT